MADEITIESIESSVESADQLSEEQKTFLEEHKAELSDEQATKFGVTKEPEEIKPEVRGATPAAPVVQDDGKGKKKDGEGEGEDEEIDPETEKLVQRVVGKQLTPLQDQIKKQQEEIQAQKDKVEIDAYIAANPDFAKYRKGIEAYAQHPAYKNVPIANIATIVASKDLMKIGAQKEREAAEAAARSKGGGSSARPSGSSGKDWANASPEEVAAKRNEIMGIPSWQ